MFLHICFDVWSNNVANISLNERWHSVSTFYVRIYLCRNIIHEENEILDFRMNRKFVNLGMWDIF